MLLPYLDGERTPNLPAASGTLLGLRRDAMTPANLARAAVEGMLCGLADGLDALRAQGVEVYRVLLVGGAAQSRAVRAVAAQILDAPVAVPEPAEYAARGAARQAAWALSGAPDAPSWTLAVLPADPSAAGAGSAPFVHERYAEMRDAVHGRPAEVPPG